jgi:hypothetical protein
MKHDWPKNVLRFRRGGRRIRIHTTKGCKPVKATALVYAESVNMLEGLMEEEADTFLQENLTLVPLYEINIVKEAEPYQISDEAAIIELNRAREALEWELAVSQRVRPTELEELNLGTAEEPRNVLIAKELDTEFKEQLTHVLRTYKDVFAWSYEDIFKSGHLLAVFTLSIVGRAILVICQNVWCPSLGV